MILVSNYHYVARPTGIFGPIYQEEFCHSIYCGDDPCIMFPGFIGPFKVKDIEWFVSQKDINIDRDWDKFGCVKGKIHSVYNTTKSLLPKGGIYCHAFGKGITVTPMEELCLM